jgi:hypothetical protein
VINKHFGRMAHGGGYQVMVRTNPDLVFTPEFSLGLDDVDVVLEGAEGIERP